MTRMAISVNVTVAMSPEMLNSIEQQKPEGMSRAEFIRRCVREDTDDQLTVEDLEDAARNSAEV